MEVREAEECPCQRAEEVRAWIRGLALTRPTPLDDAHTVALAAAYEDGLKSDWGRDYIARILAQRDKVVSDLLRAPYDRATKADDASLRAMLHALDRILEIPQQIQIAYFTWRRLDSERQKRVDRATERTLAADELTFP